MVDHTNRNRIVLWNGDVCTPKERVEELFIKMQDMFVGLEPLSNEGSLKMKIMKKF